MTAQRSAVEQELQLHTIAVFADAGCPAADGLRSAGALVSTWRSIPEALHPTAPAKSRCPARVSRSLGGRSRGRCRTRLAMQRCCSSSCTGHQPGCQETLPQDVCVCVCQRPGGHTCFELMIARVMSSGESCTSQSLNVPVLCRALKAMMFSSIRSLPWSPSCTQNTAGEGVIKAVKCRHPFAEPRSEALEPHLAEIRAVTNRKQQLQANTAQ